MRNIMRLLIPALVAGFAMNFGIAMANPERVEDAPPRNARLWSVVAFYPMAAIDVDSLRHRLERSRLATARAESDLTADAKKAALDVVMLTAKLEIAEDARMRWYQSPSIWFPAGILVGALVVETARSVID
jgi:hypothetical protein